MLFKYSILLILFAVMSICSVAPRNQGVISVSQIKTSASSLNFERDLKPIFEKRCNPCHFPGGKLYERLPFDQAATIIENEKGILRRISDTVEVKMIREFVEENMSAKADDY